MRPWLRFCRVQSGGLQGHTETPGSARLNLGQLHLRLCRKAAFEPVLLSEWLTLPQVLYRIFASACKRGPFPVNDLQMDARKSSNVCAVSLLISRNVHYKATDTWQLWTNKCIFKRSVKTLPCCVRLILIFNINPACQRLVNPRHSRF